MCFKYSNLTFILTEYFYDAEYFFSYLKHLFQNKIYLCRESKLLWQEM